MSEQYRARLSRISQDVPHLTHSIARARESAPAIAFGAHNEGQGVRTGGRGNAGRNSKPQGGGQSISRPPGLPEESRHARKTDARMDRPEHAFMST
jgi:hypothetical protein